MRTITCTYTTNMMIIFDYDFELKFSGSLDKAINKAEWAMDTYHFTNADITDATTGEVLARVED